MRLGLVLQLLDNELFFCMAAAAAAGAQMHINQEIPFKLYLQIRIVNINNLRER